jgi:hypothetical protein
VKKSLFTESDVFALLRTFYPKDSCALLPQVADRTGSPTRHADAIAMQLWPSRGLTIDGIEIKVDRRDWLRELEKPEKADVIYRFCDRWYIAAPSGIVEKGELPPTWGLLEIITDKEAYIIRETVKAPKNVDLVEPGRAFLAALLRALQKNTVSERELQEARDQAHGKATAYIDERVKRETQLLTQQVEKYQKAIATFEKASGVKIDGYWPENNQNLGEAVRALTQSKAVVTGTLRQLKNARTNAEGRHSYDW